MNIYCISTATKNIIMEVPEKIQIYMLSVAHAYDGILIEIFLKTHYLEYIFKGNWS